MEPASRSDLVDRITRRPHWGASLIVVIGGALLRVEGKLPVVG